MATDTHNQLGNKDSRAALWIVLAIIAAVILGYAAYANYYYSNTTTTPNYGLSDTAGPVTNTN